MKGQYLLEQDEEDERCSARDWDRIRITWGNPQSGCSEMCSYLMGRYRCTRNLCYQVKLRYEASQVWMNATFIPQGLKPRLQNNCAKSIGAYNMHKQILKYTQILAVKNIKQNLLQNKLAELTAKIINSLKCWRLPTIHKILIYIKMLSPQNVGALKCRRL